MTHLNWHPTTVKQQSQKHSQQKHICLDKHSPLEEKLGYKSQISIWKYVGRGIELRKGLTIRFLQIACCLGNFGFKCLISTPFNKNITNFCPSSGKRPFIYTGLYRLIVLHRDGILLHTECLWRCRITRAHGQHFCNRLRWRVAFFSNKVFLIKVCALFFSK